MFRRERKSNTLPAWGGESSVSYVSVVTNVGYCKNLMYFML